VHDQLTTSAQAAAPAQHENECSSGATASLGQALVDPTWAALKQRWEESYAAYTAAMPFDDAELQLGRPATPAEVAIFEAAAGQHLEDAGSVQAFEPANFAELADKAEMLRLTSVDPSGDLEVLIDDIKRLANCERGEVARLYPQWLAALAASGEEQPGCTRMTEQFAELEAKIEATPCRTVADTTAKLKVLLDVCDGMVLDRDHIVEQLKDAIAGLEQDPLGHQQAATSGEWEVAVAQYNRAKAANDAFNAQSDEAQEEQEEAGKVFFEAYCEAVHALEATDPPTLSDLAFVLRASIELDGMDYAFQHVDCPDTFSDFLASDDHLVASRARAYLSLLRATGSNNPVLDATLWERFPQEDYYGAVPGERRAAWLAHHEHRRSAALAEQPAANLIAAE
jgi:hypothetical protein